MLRRPFERAVDEFEVTVHKWLGIAAQDLAAAHAINQRAREAGVGIRVEL